MDVGNAVLCLVNKGRTSDVVPHLTRYHGEYEEQRHHAPSILVLKKLKVVAPQVEQRPDLKKTKQITKQK